MRRTWVPVVIIAALSLLVFSQPSVRSAHASTIIVNTLSDVTSGNCASQCSLRDAIGTAASGDTITFNVSGTITLSNGMLALNKDLTITGPGATTLTLVGTGGSRIFLVSGGIMVTISGLALQNGYADGGGAIYNAGTLIIDACEIKDSRADYSGGGIYNSGDLTVRNSTLDANTALYGGGINNAGAANLINSTISGNSAAGSFNHSISTNTPFPLSPTSVGGTATPVFSGYSAADGGGILNDIGGTMAIRSSTIASNSAGHFGGCILNYGTLNLLSSIVAGNSGLYHPADLIGTIASQGHNIIQDMSEASGFASTDQRSIDPLLGTLTLNPPGTTRTISIPANSPAIGKGDCTGISVDQRGVTRKSPCDVGAYEMSGVMTPTATRTATPTTTLTATLTATSTPAPRPDTIGVYENGVFYLRNSNTTGYADITVPYNPWNVPTSRLLPVVGDWNGDGVDTIGVYDTSLGVFLLRDSNTPGSYDYSLVMGNPGDEPIAGKWDASMSGSGVGVYRPSNGLLYVKKTLTTGFADYTMVLGNPGDHGIAGDWDGNGYDSVGVYRPSKTTFFLANPVAGDTITPAVIFSDYAFVFGPANLTPLAGDWTGSGQSRVGYTLNGVVYLKNTFTSGGADNVFTYGLPGARPVAGKWTNGGVPAPNVIVPVKTSVPPTHAPSATPPSGDGGGLD